MAGPHARSDMGSSNPWVPFRTQSEPRGSRFAGQRSHAGSRLPIAQHHPVGTATYPRFMALHHVVPKLLLRRWSHPDSGLIEVLDRRAWRLSREDPARFAALQDYNTVLDSDGNPDDWIESELLAGLDNAAAMALRQIDVLPRPTSLARQAASKGWHPTHVMSPRLSARLAMWVAAQAVRTSTFRDAVTRSTTSDMQRQIASHYEAELAKATDDTQRAHFQYMAGIRVVGTRFDQNSFPHLMAHLVVRLGEILYAEYAWAIQRMARPSLILGDDPVLLLNINEPRRCGSYSHVATTLDDPVSLWLPWDETVKRAIATMRGNHLVAMPLGPQHLLTLSPTSLLKPGRYDMPPENAKPYNTIITSASRRWVCATPADIAPEPRPASVTGVAEFGRALIRSQISKRERATDLGDVPSDGPRR
ncbi:MAG TPA: DUF4238 domain-containing protein [Solirubrobacteraceae bacterium]|nr:DUF4238 domain-containing protein [Solirubrobacteraceae bacterium]